MQSKLELFRNALQTGGVGDGLRFLNRPVDHRYTAVYRLRNSMLTNVALHDKEGEVTPEFLMEVPLEDSFCQFVMRDGLFKTIDSAQDRRLDGHKYQGALLSYHGVPILDNQGQLFGTLCHFDALQRTLPDAEFEFLQQAARLLPAFLPTQR